MLADTNARCGSLRAASVSASKEASSWAYVRSWRSDTSTTNGHAGIRAALVADSRRPGSSAGGNRPLRQFEPDARLLVPLDAPPRGKALEDQEPSTALLCVAVRPR